MTKALAVQAQLVAPSSHWRQKNLVVVRRIIRMMMILKMTLMMMRGRWRTTGDVFCL